MLIVRKISANYGGVRALYSVTLEQNKGEIVTLIGSNGAGKTSLLNIISGILRPTAGKVYFNGQDITAMPPEKIVELGISQVPEGRHLFDTMTVKENLELGAYKRRGVGRRKIMEDMDKVFRLFPILKERLNQRAETLSGGEQQMVAIGRGLMSKPLLLLLDEPTLGLAPMVVEEILATIQRLRDMGTTILMVEQNARAALRISDRGYVLQAGTIGFKGSASELLNNENVKQAYLGKEPYTRRARV
ncbi:MAG: ABC transporter ATP-binding protein [Deltaproteobacteria bacterium]|nr:ABC transporter ATP-binding protein [Deltaproteobacteria bacterium]MBW1962382.1 ABC transporter ATP-binding protein [Deltaproteobacteria bacterium]MBW2151062.1 ABC transporter ATP-binding protein [Deltaproteobacteria bacterium]